MTLNNIHLIKLIIMVWVISQAMVGCTNDDARKFMTGRIVPKAEYTQDKPGEWAGMESEHLPQVTVNDSPDDNIYVFVPLKSASNNHYIQCIGIMDQNKKDLAVKYFNRSDKYFDAHFSLHPVPEGNDIKVFVSCNLHNLWTIPLSKAKRIK